MDIGDVISSVLSLFAIALTITMYFKHDKRLKKQEEKLNAYQLRKMEDEEFESKKAQVKGSIIKLEKERRDLKISNGGKAPAKNVVVTFLDNVAELDSSAEKVTIMKYPSPFELLNSGDHFDIVMYINFYRSTDTLKIKLTWEDELSNKNEHIQCFKL